MSDQGRGKISRRTFITTGVAGSLLVPVFLDDLGAALAQTGGKPPLTIASLNELFRRAHAGGAAQAAPLYREAQANLEGFLLRQFTLSPGQLAMVREAVQLRGAGLQSFYDAALRQLGSGKPAIAPVASFDPRTSPFVELNGFGQRINPCRNPRVGALKASPRQGPAVAVQECGGPTTRSEALLNDCQFVMNCVAAGVFPRGC